MPFFIEMDLGIVPYTTESEHPAFSKTLPFESTREIPPPPPGRVHASSRNDAPSSSSIASQITFCARRQFASNFRRMSMLAFPSHRQ